MKSRNYEIMEELYGWYDAMSADEYAHLTAGELLANLRFAPSCDVIIGDYDNDFRLIDMNWEESTVYYIGSEAFEYCWKYYIESLGDTGSFNREDFVNYVKTHVILNEASIHNVYNKNKLSEVLSGKFMNNKQ